MTVSINFIGLGGSNYTINNLANSGLGFFGAGFGQAVNVGSYQDSTFITDGNGINQGPQVNNVKWVHSGSGQLPGGANVALPNIPNFQGTMQIQVLSPGTPIQLQNSRLYIYDRFSVNNPASGVVTACSNLIHPNPVQGPGGSGDATWEFPSGSSYMLLSVRSDGQVFSPGASGYSIHGQSTSDTQHDYYVALSANPSSIGSKSLYSALFSTEYL